MADFIERPGKRRKLVISSSPSEEELDKKMDAKLQRKVATWTETFAEAPSLHTKPPATPDMPYTPRSSSVEDDVATVVAIPLTRSAASFIFPDQAYLRLPSKDGRRLTPFSQNHVHSHKSAARFHNQRTAFSTLSWKISLSTDQKVASEAWNSAVWIGYELSMPMSFASLNMSPLRTRSVLSTTLA